MKKAVFLVGTFLLVTSCKTKMQQFAPPPPQAPHIEGMETMQDPTSGRGVLMAADRGVLMKNGTMMTMKDGKLVTMDQVVLLDNGDKVMTNGEIVHKDGTKTMMTEGMMMDKNGTMMDKDGKKVDAKMMDSGMN